MADAKLLGLALRYVRDRSRHCVKLNHCRSLSLADRVSKAQIQNGGVAHQFLPDRVHGVLQHGLDHDDHCI